MGKRARAAGVTNAALRAARAAWREQDDEAARIAQSVYNAIAEAERTGEAGDVHPLLWGSLVITADLMAQVAVRSERLAAERREEVAAYFAAAMLAGVQVFDREHFEAWCKTTDPEEGTDAAADDG